MSQLIPWVRSLRPLVSIFSGILVLVGFHVGRNVLTHEAWLFAVATTVICATTMLQNDWRDRWRDKLKGKTLALDYPRFFLAWLILWWVITSSLAAIAAREHPQSVWLLAALLIVAAAYSETRLIPLLPMVLVAITSAAPVLFPITCQVGTTGIWRLFWVASILVAAREILKDLEDAKGDRGSKWTIPVAFGEKTARVVAGVLLVAAMAILLQRTTWYFTPLLLAVVAISNGPEVRMVTAAKWLLTATLGFVLIGTLYV